MPDPTTWTIIAAIAQIVAAIFAAYTIWQSRKMLHQAELQRKDSIAPAWEVQSGMLHCPYYPHSGIYYVDIALRNTGNGPARHVEVAFDAKRGGSLCNESKGLGTPATQNVVLVDQEHLVQLFWEPQKPLDGVLWITSISRLGEKRRQEFHVSTYIENEHDAFCKVTPA